MSALWLREAQERRFGIKGPRAAILLRQIGLNVPSAPNTWSPLRPQDRDDSINVIARLGNSEFFIEEQGGERIAALEAMNEPGAWPVLREDFALVLGGARATDALAEVCNIDFAGLDTARKPVVMTLMTGVSVLVLPQSTDAGMTYRIWCDPSFGPYLWETLQDVVSTSTGRAA
jgi:sarcosine oxidase subunit gamma